MERGRCLSVSHLKANFRKMEKKPEKFQQQSVNQDQTEMRSPFFLILFLLYYHIKFTFHNVDFSLLIAEVVFANNKVKDLYRAIYTSIVN